MGVNALAFEFSRESPPPGAVVDAGVEGKDEETLLRLVVCVWGDGVVCGGWALGGIEGVRVGVPGVWRGCCCPLGDMGRAAMGVPGVPCGGWCCGGMCCCIHG